VPLLFFFPGYLYTFLNETTIHYEGFFFSLNSENWPSL
jgi:hypothetical protein